MHCIFLLVGTIFGNADIEDALIFISHEVFASTGYPAYEPRSKKRKVLGAQVRNFLYAVFYRAANVVYVTSR
jgi:hypothetical protein